MDPALAAAAAAWARQPSLAPALRDPDGVYFVLDPADGRILHASPAARPLAALLAGSGGAALARQAAQAGAGPDAPRLARLRLDARRIAPPVVCLVARGTRDGDGPALLVVPTAPVTLPRPRPAGTAGPALPPRPQPEPQESGPLESSAQEPESRHSAPRADRPRVGDRFLWRSDASGALTALTGVDALTRLVGQDWRSLAEAGRLSGGGAMLAALGERRTFRAEPASLDLGAGAIAVELSGAPLGRGDAGFGGFGVIRGVPDPVAAQAVPQPVAAADAEPGPVSAEPPGAPAETALSTDEHDAFREIARALGARYAGDDEPAAPRPEGGAVMPFRSLQAEILYARPPVAPAPEAEAGILAGLPLPALLYRGEAILAANRPLLDLTGYADLAGLAAAGLGRLFRGLPPPGAADPDARRTAIETAAGHPCPVEVLRGACTWAGEAAACLILRPLGAQDPASALTAERLAREAQAARAIGAEAALDALETGVVTVDGAGRVVALNRAAAALFGCEARETVGSPFVALFGQGSAPVVAELLSGVAAPPRAVSAGGKALTLSLSPVRADGGRVAVLDAAVPREVPGTVSPAVQAAEAVRARPPERRDTVLPRLDRELRAPMNGIIDLTGALLREPFGPLGDARYRHGLAEIEATGERMLERLAELLDLAAVEAGMLDLDPRPLALNDVVAGCVARLQPEAVRGRIVLRTSFSADLADMEGDERSVSRAVCLVIEQAIRRSAAGSQVIVSTGPVESAGVALRVRDTGAGRQATGSQGTPEDDLALPRALVEANGGRLRLASRADEDGTLVEILLPAARAGRG